MSASGDERRVRSGTGDGRRTLAQAAAEGIRRAEEEARDRGEWGFVSTMDRRDFMRLTTTGLLITFSVKPPKGMAHAKWNPANLQRPSPDFNAFVHIGTDERVTVLVGKIEMGQGVMTSLPQMAAEELNVTLDKVDVVMGDTDLCPFDMGTYGSLSTPSLGPVLRAAAAEGKATLMVMGAGKLGVPVSELEVVDGVVRVKGDGSRAVSYGQLTGGKRIERTINGQAALERVGDFTIMGISTPRRDAPAKVTGKAKYSGDIIPKGALHARIVRPPAHGATLKSIDMAAAEKYPGARVVRAGELIAVLHAHRDEADKALKLVKTEWNPSPSTLDDQNIFDHLEKNAPAAANAFQKAGDVATGEKLATKVITTKYLKGYVAHSPMETHSACCEIAADGKVTVWASTQTPFPLQTQVARALNVPPQQVRVITPFVGGGFGGKSMSTQAVEAAQLAKAAGVPVRVVWSREEEFFFDPFDPATVVNIRSGLTAERKIAFWDYEVVAAGARGAQHFYDIAHHTSVARGSWGQNNGLHPFAVGPWRAPGANANTFARESHIDQLAAAAGIDPVEFRLQNMAGNPRMQWVLRTAAEKFGYKAGTLPSKRGIGVACGIDAGAYVAGLAEVKVDRGTGSVTVVRVVVAQDMGIVVNPIGATQQMEGCVTQGLGYVLSEEVRFRNGEVLDKNYTTYALPRFSWVPKIETVLVENHTLPPQGGGEPAIVLMGAMVANAIFDLTGVRMTRLPLTKARVKAALT